MSDYSHILEATKEAAKTGVKQGLLQIPKALRSKGLSINNLSEHALTRSEKKQIQNVQNRFRRSGVNNIKQSLGKLFNSSNVEMTESKTPLYAFRPIQPG